MGRLYEVIRVCRCFQAGLSVLVMVTPLNPNSTLLVLDLLLELLHLCRVQAALAGEREEARTRLKLCFRLSDRKP